MQIVAQTRQHSGSQAYRTLSSLGLPCIVYYAWKRRESLGDRAGLPCRIYELLSDERTAICADAVQYPKIGYRKLTWMMIDAGTVCAGEGTVYRVLDKADPLSRWKRSVAFSGEYNCCLTGPTSSGTRT